MGLQGKSLKVCWRIETDANWDGCRHDPSRDAGDRSSSWHLGWIGQEQKLPDLLVHDVNSLGLSPMAFCIAAVGLLPDYYTTIRVVGWRESPLGIRRCTCQVRAETTERFSFWICTRAIIATIVIFCIFWKRNTGREWNGCTNKPVGLGRVGDVAGRRIARHSVRRCIIFSQSIGSKQFQDMKHAYLNGRSSLWRRQTAQERHSCTSKAAGLRRVGDVAVRGTLRLSFVLHAAVYQFGTAASRLLSDRLTQEWPTRLGAKCRSL